MDVSNRHGRVRTRVGWIMAGLALVPLAGLLWFATLQISSALDHRNDASAVLDASTGSVALVQLATAVAEEKHWTHAVNSLADLAVDPALMAEIVGIDVLAEQTRARAAVDAWLDQLHPTPFAASIVDLRTDSNRSTVEVTAAFAPVEETIEDAHHEQIEQAITLAAGLQGGTELVQAARVLEAAATLRADMSWQFGSFFGARFMIDRSPVDETRHLVQRSASYRANLTHLEQLAAEGSRSTAALARLQADDDVQAFAARLEAQIDDALRGRLAEPAQDISAEVNEPGAIARTFTVAHNATRAHLDLVTAAGDDVAAQARAMASVADRELVKAVATGLVIALLSLIASLAATQVIVGPLWRLSEAAAMLRTGRLDVEVDERGPVELKTAARAMNEAIGQLQLVERQALALADGATDDPVLETEAPGRLGASLQRAVTQLRRSLAEREEYRRRLAHEASHDGLTGMPNRRAASTHLNQALARTRRSRETLAVLFIDLDDFKAVNDLHGHGAGDRMVVQIGQRIEAAVREGDLAGRLGGDEFVVIAEPVSDDEDALALAERVMAAIREPLTVGGLTMQPRCSIGVALPHVESADADSLIHDADLAMYEAKRKGRDRAELCTSTLRAQVAERGLVERGLASALANGDLLLHFQTVTDAATGAVVSLEALVRWQHPDDGLLLPGAFIPVAERSDLIVELDRWVLDTAVARLAAWEGHPELGSLPIAVNISSRHLARPDLATRVLGILALHGVAASRLVLEVTESALLDDLDTAANTLQQLRDHGVLVAIDDFGTGYTSLAHLRTLPVDILKIDRTYVTDLGNGDASLVNLIIDTGHLLGFRVTAEGVETRAQADALRGLGVDALQGFLFSHPAPVEALDIPGCR